MEWSKKVYKKINQPALKFCKWAGLSANQITIINHFITLTLGIYYFSRGTYLGWMIGLCVMVINGYLDYLDGDLARNDKNNNSELGSWLDCGFDIVIQNAVLGSIGIGCIKMGMPFIWVVFFYIGNTASNFVSFNYNTKFGFDSYRGNELFRNLMSKSYSTRKKNSSLNIILKHLIDPTSSFTGLALLTYRYFIALGCVFNVMPYCFIIFTIITNIKWIVMFIIYSLYLKGNKNLHVLKVLSALDDERAEFFKLRYSS